MTEDRITVRCPSCKRAYVLSSDFQDLKVLSLRVVCARCGTRFDHGRRFDDDEPSGEHVSWAPADRVTAGDGRVDAGKGEDQSPSVRAPNPEARPGQYGGTVAVRARPYKSRARLKRQQQRLPKTPPPKTPPPWPAEPPRPAWGTPPKKAPSSPPFRDAAELSRLTLWRLYAAPVVDGADAEEVDDTPPPSNPES